MRLVSNSIQDRVFSPPGLLRLVICVFHNLGVIGMQGKIIISAGVSFLHLKQFRPSCFF
jgi:hypothetical protein